MSQTFLLLNDVHLGVRRSAGTTLESRKAVKQYLLDELKKILYEVQTDTIINGDLFDGYEVELSDVLSAYFIFADWLKDCGFNLHLVQGNHDIAKNSEKVGAFAFLCSLLQSLEPTKVYVYTKGLAQIAPGLWVIPHVPNQDLFDLELDKAMGIEPSMILFHANVDNQFAEEADHSLNVCDERIRSLAEQGHTLVFAHEHHHKWSHKGKVIVCGNQWPSSIYDCLTMDSAQSDGVKYAHIIVLDDEQQVPSMQMFETWRAAGDFIDVDWQCLDEVTTERFIRVSGNAKQEQAQDVITMIAKYRSKSSAFVITNSVRVEGVQMIDDLADLTQDRLQSIDVLQELKKELTDEEGKTVDWLLEKKRAAA